MTARNLLVLGATGATGQLVVSQALAAGHHVTALVRSPDKLTARHANLTVITGQATRAADVKDALPGADAVISTLGAMKGSVMTDATRALLAAAGREDPRRIVMLSSFALARDRLTGPAKAISGLMMSAAIKDRTTAEELLRASGRNYVIAHATRLTNGAATGTAHVVPDGTPVSMSNSVSRADVATWLLDAATQGTPSTRRDVVISTGQRERQ
jgi:uncharacterized protein YbjT (DUF2867 family)